MEILIRAGTEMPAIPEEKESLLFYIKMIRTSHPGQHWEYPVAVGR